MSKHQNLDGLADRLPKPPAPTAQPPGAPDPQKPPEGVKPPEAVVDPANPPTTTPPQTTTPPPAVPPTTVPKVPDSLLNPQKPQPKPDDPPAPIPETELGKLPVGAQQAIRNQRAHIDRLEAVIADLKKKPSADAAAIDQRIAEIQRERDEALSQIERISLERSPRFKAKFDRPKQQILTQIKQYMKEFGVEDLTIADQAARLSIKDRMSLLARECGDAVSVLVPLFASMDSIDRTMEAELSSARETFQREEEEERRRIEDFKGSIMQAALDELRDGGHFVFAEVPGQDEWNKNVESIRNNVRSVLASTDSRVTARSLALGVAAPIYLQMFHEERKLTESLQAELAKYRRATPRISGDGTPPDPSTFDKSKPMTADAAAAALAARVQTV